MAPKLLYAYACRTHDPLRMRACKNIKEIFLQCANVSTNAVKSEL